MDISADESSLLFDNLFHLSQIMNSLSRKVEAEVGLTWQQLMAVRLIEETSPETVGDLSATMKLHPASTGSLLDRLEDRGFVKRSRNRVDRRIVHVDLTEAGRKISAAIPGLAAAILAGNTTSSEKERITQISGNVQAITLALAAVGGKERSFPANAGEPRKRRNHEHD